MITPTCGRACSRIASASSLTSRTCSTRSISPTSTRRRSSRAWRCSRPTRPTESASPGERIEGTMKQRLVIGAAVVAIAAGLAGCGKKQQPAPAPGPSASSVALQPLIQQYADLERKDEDDESGGLRDVSLDGFKKEIDTRRELLEKIRQVEATGLSREEDIDRRLMIGLLESTIHTAQARRMWENDASLYVPAGEIGRALEPTAPGTPQERAANLTKLLEQVPARIEQARTNLVKPPR